MIKKKKAGIKKRVRIINDRAQRRLTGTKGKVLKKKPRARRGPIMISSSFVIRVPAGKTGRKLGRRGSDIPVGRLLTAAGNGDLSKFRTIDELTEAIKNAAEDITPLFPAPGDQRPDNYTTIMDTRAKETARLIIDRYGLELGKRAKKKTTKEEKRAEKLASEAEMAKEREIVAKQAEIIIEARRLERRLQEARQRQLAIIAGLRRARRTAIAEGERATAKSLKEQIDEKQKAIRLTWSPQENKFIYSQMKKGEHASEVYVKMAQRTSIGRKGFKQKTLESVRMKMKRIYKKSPSLKKSRKKLSRQQLLTAKALKSELLRRVARTKQKKLRTKVSLVEPVIPRGFLETDLSKRRRRR